jgi:BirA family biotin operon repressor/biotin-[acetyl-CoA-carboxylase] ligase
MSSLELGVQSALTTKLIGRPFYYHPVVGSTMDEARRLAQAGVPEGTVVLADEQVAGRGRLQRRWWAPAGSSLLLSLVLRPLLGPRHAQRLTMICSLAVCDAIAQVSGLRAMIKWPNDVLLGGRKVCGILTELDLVGDELRYAIVGIGINVNVDFTTAPPLMSPATSLSMETGRAIPRLDLLVALLSGIEKRYLALRDGRSWHQEWADRMATLGQHVRVSSGSEQWHGLAVGVDEDGALLLQLEDGSTRRVLAGDVTSGHGVVFSVMEGVE